MQSEHLHIHLGEGFSQVVGEINKLVIFFYSTREQQRAEIMVLKYDLLFYSTKSILHLMDERLNK